MKKTMLFALGLLLVINAWSYDNVSAAFTWTKGNEANATVASEASDGVKETKLKVGADLTKGERSNLAANNGVAMATYTPTTGNPGVVEGAMIEYSVKMKKGITFTLTGISYDLIKQGTDNASYDWTYTVDGVASDTTKVPADSILRDNKTTPALHHMHAVTANAGRTVTVRFYVSGFGAGKLFCISNLVLTGSVNGEEEVRAFTGFKVDFRSEEPTWVEPTSQPSFVTLNNIHFHDAQHGIDAGTINVTVDGPVKFTLGGCGYGTNIAVKKGTETLATIDNKSAGCDNSGVNGGYTKFVTWTYNVEEAAELNFTVNGYLPYMFAEACDFVPQVEVRYYDTDGKTLIGKDTVDGGSELAYKYGATDVTVVDGKKFRGWYNSNGPTATKVAERFSLTEDLSLYAKATEIEVAALGKIFDYDFRLNYFYPEDHELLTFTGGNSRNGSQHGWAFSSGSTLSIQVAGNALLAVDVCTFSNTDTTDVTDAAGKKVGELVVVKNETADGSKQTIYYEGDATTLTFHFDVTNYIHHIKVYNVAALPEKDDQLGYYIIAPGDGAALKLVLESLQNGDKIFLPNGVYDFGEDVLTQISKSNVSIIGQSMEGTIIRNKPDFHNEGIGTTATFFIPGGVSGTYFQDLTIQNDMDYFAALAALNNGRAVCLQDKGTHTVLKNVRMLSNQDTYYSNNVGVQHYFEDCEIHGTVDFICGGGSVYFKNNVLFCEKRNANGGGSDCITAHQGKDANGDKGYVFEGCTIMSVCPTVSFGRAWGDQARTYFLNTLVDYSEGEFGFTGSGIQRWTQSGINTNPTAFGEYNTHTADGTILTPATNEVTFNKGSNITMETVLNADSASKLTMAYTLGDWATTAAADAAQAVCEKEATDLEANAIYLAETNGEFIMLLKGSEFFDKLALYNNVEYTLRKANARGGFGKKADSAEEAIENAAIDNSKVEKIIRNGEVLIIRNGRTYNILGKMYDF